MTSLQELAEQKRQQFLRKFAELGFDEELWEKRLQELYLQIIEWLTPLADDGLLRFIREQVPTGRYVATFPKGEEGTQLFFEERATEMFVIKFFHGETVNFIPVGANIIDAYGLVDMWMAQRKVMIVLLTKESDWYFAERRGTLLETYEFNQYYFEEHLAEFAETFYF